MIRTKKSSSGFFSYVACNECGRNHRNEQKHKTAKPAEKDLEQMERLVAKDDWEISETRHLCPVCRTKRA